MKYRNFVATFFVLCLASASVALADNKEEAVPAVIEAKGVRTMKRQNFIAEQLNELHESNHWNTDELWAPIFFMNEMAIQKSNAAAYEYQLCVTTKEGYYCEQSLRDLNEANYELDKLEKAISDAEKVKL